MVSSNPSHLELKVLDTSFPLEVRKPSSLVDSSHLPPSLSTSFSPLHHFDKSSQSRSMVKLLNNIETSPESSPHVTLHKLSGTRLKKISDLTQSNTQKRSTDCLKIDQKKPSGMHKGQSINESTSNTFQKHTGHTKNVLNKPQPLKDKTHQNFQKVDNGATTAKRHLEPVGVQDIVRKKLHTENADQIGNSDEELEAFNFIKVLDIEVDDSRDDDLNPSMLLQQSSTQDNKMQLESDNVIEDDATTNIKEENLESADGMDIFGLDGLGIKILDEIFLCSKCQNEIPAKDLDNGCQDVCSSCMEKDKEKEKEKETFSRTVVTTPVPTTVPTPVLTTVPTPRTETKVILGDILPESDSDFNSNSQAFGIRILPVEKVEKVFEMDKKMNRYFRKELQFEHDIKHPNQDTDDDDWTGIDLFDPKYNKSTLLCSGPNYQAEIPTLNLHKKRPKREIKRLWNPRRLEDAIFEKFTKEISLKNAVELLEEELAEILVRNQCDYNKAILWSTKGNPDFQFYVKRCSNRRRALTKMAPKFNE